MAELKCEFPEGCRLDLFAKSSKQVHRQTGQNLDTMFCVPDEQVGGKITNVKTSRSRSKHI